MPSRLYCRVIAPLDHNRNLEFQMRSIVPEVVVVDSEGIHPGNVLVQSIHPADLQLL